MDNVIKFSHNVPYGAWDAIGSELKVTHLGQCTRPEAVFDMYDCLVVDDWCACLQLCDIQCTGTQSFNNHTSGSRHCKVFYTNLYSPGSIN